MARLGDTIATYPDLTAPRIWEIEDLQELKNWIDEQWKLESGLYTNSMQATYQEVQLAASPLCHRQGWKPAVGRHCHRTREPFGLEGRRCRPPQAQPARPKDYSGGV